MELIKYIAYNKIKYEKCFLQNLEFQVMNSNSQQARDLLFKIVETLLNNCTFLISHQYVNYIMQTIVKSEVLKAQGNFIIMSLL